MIGKEIGERKNKQTKYDEWNNNDKNKEKKLNRNVISCSLIFSHRNGSFLEVSLELNAFLTHHHPYKRV